MEDLTELTKAIAQYDWGKTGTVLLAIDAEIRKVAGHPEHVARLESALLDVLQSDASLPAVDAALRSALGRTTGLARVGVIHSIGNRKDGRAAPALGNLLRDRDERVAAAAAWALGRIGGAESIRLLGEHLSSARVRFRQELLDAYLICARRLASEGRKSDARAMFKELSADAMPAPVRRAAAVGIKTA